MKKSRRAARADTVDDLKYTGKLAEPIKAQLPRLGILADPADVAAALRAYHEAVSNQRSAKLSTLFAHFGIEPDAALAWEALAIGLAIRHVRGFQVAKQRGAPKKALTDAEVCQEIYDYLHDHPRANISAACKALTRTGQVLAGMKAERARRIYSANGKWREFLADARRWQELQSRTKKLH